MSELYDPIDGPGTGPQLPGVLVVDDDRLVRLVVQLGLERDGFKVWLAASGPEAIRLYREHRQEISAVLLDVCMPGMGGPATLAALREEGADVPVCFMSGDLGGHSPDDLIGLGAVQLIAKPFRLDDLSRVLQRIVSGSPVAPMVTGGE